MIKIDKKHGVILELVLEKTPISSSAMHKELLKTGLDISLVTVKRALSDMAKSGLLMVIGSGPATNYEISILGRMFVDINAKRYCAIEPDKRYGLNQYNFRLFQNWPAEIFSEEELAILGNATREYEKRATDLSATILKKEMERLVIELSWKSSRIEGNTYTLLDTEKLILENKEAPGHDKKEAWMILNHKNAFALIHENKTLFRTLTRTNLEQLHSVLVKDLSINSGLRQKPVGVTGSKYRPLDNGYQIAEAVESLSRAVSLAATPYARALTVLLGISYIQPFEDGNKRTARLMANAMLLSHGCAPLSYRSVDEGDYREAMLVFYEINSIMPLKNIFISQYEFAANNYSVK